MLHSLIRAPGALDVVGVTPWTWWAKRTRRLGSRCPSGTGGGTRPAASRSRSGPMTHLHGNHQARRAALEAARADDSDVWYAPV